MGLNILHRKEQLILTTIDIIDELGIQKLTTREIAKRQQISEATLFRHFKNKNELLIAVLDYFVQFDTDILESTKMLHLKPIESILYLTSSYAEYYENYPAITSILLDFNVLMDEEELSGKMIEIQECRISTIQLMVEEAVRTGELRTDVETKMIAVMIYGFFRELCLNWKISNCNFSLKERSLSTLEMLLLALHNKS